MEPFILSREIVESAVTYLPVREKMKMIDECLDGCFDIVNVKAENGGESVALPPMNKENSLRKARYLLSILAIRYLKIPVETEEKNPSLITEAEYDRLISSHIYNQLERAKSDKELKDRVFDIMADYKDFEKRLNTEIYGFLQIMNDPASRILSALGEAGSSAIFEEAKSGMEQVMNMLSDRIKQKEGV